MNKFKVAAKRNILLVVLPYLVKRGEAKNTKIRSFRAFPYGLLSVASYVRKHATSEVNIEVLDCNLYAYEEFRRVLRQKLKNFKPEVVGLSMMFDNSYEHLERVAKTVKEYNPDVILVLGGAAASYSYRTIMQEQRSLDALCYLEGEEPFLRLVQAEDMREFLEYDKSWITRKSLASGRDPESSFILNLDEAVHIDYTFVNIADYQMQEAFSPFTFNGPCSKRQFFLITSRGCPYKCVFCSNSAIHGYAMRYAGIKDVIEHVRHLVADYGMNVLTIYDEQLLFNKTRAKELFRQLAQFKVRIECPNGLSVAFIDKEMAELMRSAGMDTVALAIESGSDYMLKEVIRKPLRLKMVKPVVQTLRKLGFFIQGFFVIGLPGEKDEHREETLRFIKEVQLDWSGFSPATPLRGSELYDICVKNGYIKKDLKIHEIEDKKYIIRAPGLDPAHITESIYLMNLDVNFVNNYRVKAGDYQVAASCFQDVADRYANHAFAYYYLAKAQEAMNADPALVRLNRKKFCAIIAADPEWKRYADYFKLTLV